MDNNLSHAPRTSSLEEAIEKTIERLKEKTPEEMFPEYLTLIDGLKACSFGRYLLQHGGLNGEWIHYAISYPQNGKITGRNYDGEPFGWVEEMMLSKAPVVLATQERFLYFIQEIQKRIFDGAMLAAIPCGVMAELLDVDYSRISDFTLFGIDIDPEALHLASSYAHKKNLAAHTIFLERDAWDLNCKEAFDLISCTGLSIYVHEDERLELLYKELFKALKKGGTLITSFLTPPPLPNLSSEWEMSAVSLPDMILQKKIFADILESPWQCYRSEKRTRELLELSGFQIEEILYDKAHIFPTVIATKPLG